MIDLRKIARCGVGGVFAALLLVGMAGCGGAKQPAPVPPGAGEVGLGNATGGSEVSAALRDPLFVGDRIRIVFYGPPMPPQPHSETIRRDGFITPPLLGNQIKAEGKTIEELQQELHGMYVPFYYKTLTITVTAEERYFFVGGMVATPGMIPYRADMTLMKAIQAAGDLTIWAAKGRVVINRNDGSTEEYDVDDILKNPSQDPAVYPGDSVHVPRRIW
jgi:protein involved in polysaccharide export with SLBB domain